MLPPRLFFFIKQKKKISPITFIQDAIENFKNYIYTKNLFNGKLWGSGLEMTLFFNNKQALMENVSFQDLTLFSFHVF